MEERPANILDWDRWRPFVIWGLLPLLVGVLLAATIPQPVVGVIYLDDAIYSYTARDLITQITYAREHPEIRAVVLVMESPGGTVADTEAVYLELARLRATKPVVASIGAMAASGAYYLSVGTDYVFAAPTSSVGNIGVIGYLPEVPTIYEGILSTGPYKLWGASRDAYMREIEMVKQGFYEAVLLGRGDNLKAGPEVVLSGALWSGNEALRLGLIDALGTQQDAIAHAADMAHVANYETANLRDLAGIQPAEMYFFAQTPEGLSLPYPRESGVYLLYIPPSLPE